MSRPMRARGLKPFPSAFLLAGVLVAPHAGAWIETFSLCFSTRRCTVAPHAGAWIETL